MVNGSFTSFNVNDRSYLALLKKDIHRMAQQAVFGDRRLAEIDLIVSEIGSNLVKHAVQGEILAALVESEAGISLDLLAIDQGPGIADPEKMIQDGASTTHTLGHGLGSIRRLSDKFEIYSRKDWGTVLFSRIVAAKKDPPRPARKMLLSGSLVVAKPGEQVSGDGCYQVTTREGSVKILMADGLGHGPEAHHAVSEAAKAFAAFESQSPVEILRHLHVAIKKTRGMVATVAISDPHQKTWRLCGVGNIATRLTGLHQSKSYMPYNGIIGHNIPNTMNDQELSQLDYQQIVLCSDGIRSRWEHAKLPPGNKYELITQAAIIYKEFARKTDDMSVVIGRVML